MGVKMPPAWRVAVRVLSGFDFDRYRHQAAVPDAALGDDMLGEVANFAHLSA